mgnify:CR=1 FL=1
MILDLNYKKIQYLTDPETNKNLLEYIQNLKISVESDIVKQSLNIS